MTEQILRPVAAFQTDKTFNQRKDRRGLIFRNWTAWHSGALIGLLGGLIVLIGTGFLEAAEYLTGEKSHSGALFFAVLILMFAGAHCLDKVREKNLAERIERCQKYGMKDGGE